MTTKTSSRLLLAMAIILPIWVTFGRALLGSYGWFTVIYLFTIAPLLSGWLLTLFFMIRKVTLPVLDTWLFVALYICVFLHGLFIIDGGDTKESVNSVITYHFGDANRDFFGMLGYFFFFISTLLLIGLSVRAALLFANSRTNNKSLLSR